MCADGALPLRSEGDELSEAIDALDGGLAESASDIVKPIAKISNNGAEIAARIADELFENLDAPVKRVAAKDTFIAYQPVLESAILPQVQDLYLAMKDLAEY